MYDYYAYFIYVWLHIFHIFSTNLYNQMPNQKKFCSSSCSQLARDKQVQLITVKSQLSCTL